MGAAPGEISRGAGNSNRIDGEDHNVKTSTSGHIGLGIRGVGAGLGPRQGVCSDSEGKRVPKLP